MMDYFLVGELASPGKNLTLAGTFMYANR
jgi:hypothetical protein